jgi:hypothetical protein
MKYDVGMHIPTQVEALMIAYQKTPVDVPAMERALDNLKNLIKDKKFTKDLDDYSKKRLNQITELTGKALDAAKTIAGAKSFNEIYIDVQEIGKDLTMAMDSIEKDYWNHIKDYITLYLHEEPREVEKEVDEELDNK